MQFKEAHPFTSGGIVQDCLPRAGLGILVFIILYCMCWSTLILSLCLFIQHLLVGWKTIDSFPLSSTFKAHGDFGSMPQTEFVDAFVMFIVSQACCVNSKQACSLMCISCPLACFVSKPALQTSFSGIRMSFWQFYQISDVLAFCLHPHGWSFGAPNPDLSTQIEAR